MQQSEKFLQAIIETEPDCIKLLDRDGKLLMMNRAGLAMIEADSFDLVRGKAVNLLVAPEYREAFRNLTAEAFQGRQGLLEFEMIGLKGRRLWLETRAVPLRNDQSEITAVLGVTRDMTERKAVEQALQDSEKRFKRLVESVTDYIYTVKVREGRGVATVHGPGCVTVTGYSSEEYQADPDLWRRMIFEEDRDAILKKTNEILSGSPVAPFEHRIIHKDGSIRWIKNTPVPRFDKEGKLTDYDGLITDITPLKHLEAQLRQAQKMEAIGQLAGGVAHDFNNILTAIIGYGNLVLMKLPPEDASRPFVSRILSSADRAAQLTRSLLAFSRKQAIDPMPIDVNALSQRVNLLLSKLVGEDIEFKTALSDRELTVLADSVQMEQVLMNLVMNARDAVKDQGTITLETAAFELGEDFIREHGYGKPGRYARLTVSDTGEGMNEAVRRRIFEPFFTTKEVGKGTGLGLSMAYGIIKQHTGYITVSSEPGKGARFSIYLPLIDVSAPKAEITTQAAAPRGPRKEATVLLAEDDQVVRSLTKMVLENFGYRVVEAVDGEDAVRKFNEQSAAIDLLVFDVIMPKKNGKDAYLAIKQIRPGIKVLFTSGYTADIIHKKGILDADMTFIMKPISPARLLKKVREVLDR